MSIINQFNIDINRYSLQGGATNAEFPEHYLHDYRFMHHYYTPLAVKLFGYIQTRGDTRYHDAISLSGSYKAEGKALSQKYGVCIAPSVEVGAGRKPTIENIMKCLETNEYYFLYSTLSVDNEKVSGVIYWVPVILMKEWFNKYGTKNGKIGYSNVIKCIQSAEVIVHPETIRRGFSLV